jgi:hypothetical protein
MNHLKQQQEEELSRKAEEFEKNYHDNPRPTAETLNLSKILDQAIKIKE